MEDKATARRPFHRYNGRYRIASGIGNTEVDLPRKRPLASRNNSVTGPVGFEPCFAVMEGLVSSSKLRKKDVEKLSREIKMSR